MKDENNKNIKELKRKFIDTFTGHTLDSMRVNKEPTEAHLEAMTAYIGAFAISITAHCMALGWDHEKLFDYIRTVQKNQMQTAMGMYKYLQEKLNGGK